MANKFIAFIFVFISFISCARKQELIKNKTRLADIQRMLTVQKELTSKSLLPTWDIFKQQLPEPERQAMEFLYAYMPLSDLADYKPEFFLKNVQMSLKARHEMPWGETIPEEEFLHFVLPVRVNNENLDNFREVMYSEIKDRVKGLSMKDAALEINHWCHEKVTYVGTDSRTSAPLSTVKKTFGRCGEESTLTVSAMRTAGIPARQVYTPRWAHSDDNHAWVEVWIDGKWNYLGACEPDVDLNMGWFSEPATRVMLVHTRAYGRYFGKESVILNSDRFSELNLTSNYATTKKITISVKNSDGTPADSAKVEFQLYNYAEYYPIATAYTDTRGFATLITGLGDLIVRSAKNGKFAFQKLSVPEKDTLQLMLDQTTPTDRSESFDLIPPHATKVVMSITDDARKRNNRRLALEDSIRNASMKTFNAYNESAWISGFAEKTKLPVDTIYRFINLSYGNWDQITAYLEKNASQYRNIVLEMASQLSDKDFSDVSESILTDHLVQTAKSEVQKLTSSKELFSKYVLSPRIAIENLSPWRSFLSNAFGNDMAQSTRDDISVLMNWIHKNIQINAVANSHSRTPLSPIGVYNLRVADPISRDIFFVAVCRTFGIPARLNPETQIPEYYKNGAWLRAGFDSVLMAQPEEGSLRLIDKNNSSEPQYSLQYTIGILRDGFYHTLGFQEGENLFNSDQPKILEVGHYALVTGNRLDDGSVLSQMTFFTVEKGKLTTVPVEIRKQSFNFLIKGKIDMDQLISENRVPEGKKTLLSLVDGKYLLLVYLMPGTEPSKHILNDFGPYVKQFKKSGVRIVFIIQPNDAQQVDILKTFNLPGNFEIVYDSGRKILLNSILAVYGVDIDLMPLVQLCDLSGNIYFSKEGYGINVGERVFSVISMLESNLKIEVLKEPYHK